MNKCEYCELRDECEDRWIQVGNDTLCENFTKVYCNFTICIYNNNEECSKDIIHLDERVDDIFVGCPDAEWIKDEVKE